MDIDYRRSVLAGGLGSLGHGWVPKYFAAAQRLGSLSYHCAWCVIELNRTTNGYHPLRLNLPGLVNASPAAAKNRLAGGFNGQRQVAAQSRSSWEYDTLASVDRINAVLEQQHLLASLGLICVGCRSGHHDLAEVFVHRLHEKKPDLVNVFKTGLPADPDQRPDALAGYERFQQWHQEGKVAVTVMADNDGPFARAHQLRNQDEAEATAFAAFVAGPTVFLQNKSLAEIAIKLGGWSPFAGMASASRNLQSFGSRLERLGGILPGKRASYDQRRLYWVEHIVREGQHAFTRAYTELSARYIAEDINASLPCYCNFTFPLAPTDQLAWESLTSSLRQWLRTTHPNVVPSFSAGQGTPQPGEPGETWLQASLLFPIPPMPTAFCPSPRSYHGLGAAPDVAAEPIAAGPTLVRRVNGSRPSARVTRRRAHAGQPHLKQQKERNA